MAKFANRVSELQGSAIREIFKALDKPGMISFAGGAPAPELFPKEELYEIMNEVLLNKGNIALQYGITEGYAPLIKQIEDRITKLNIDANKNNQTIVVAGGQQGIDLTTKVLVNEGDGVVVECPSFIGGLNSFRSFGAKLYGVNLVDDGMDLEQLEDILKNNKNIKLIYTIPTFQNPSGITMSYEKRVKLLELAKKYNVYILEDNPYGDLRFSGEDVPTIKSMDDGTTVIYCGSFSKILSPGIRVGFVCGPKDIVEKMVVCKQVADVHTGVINQMIVSEFLKQYDIEKYIKRSRDLYGKKCKFMIDCIEKYFPSTVTHTNPEGGIFIWCDIGNGVDSKKVAAEAMEKNVAIVPGITAMYDEKMTTSAFRLNYSTVSEEKIEEGIKILGEVLSKYAK